MTITKRTEGKKDPRLDSQGNMHPGTLRRLELDRAEHGIEEVDAVFIGGTFTTIYGRRAGKKGEEFHMDVYTGKGSPNYQSRLHTKPGIFSWGKRDRFERRGICAYRNGVLSAKQENREKIKGARLEEEKRVLMEDWDLANRANNIIVYQGSLSEVREITGKRVTAIPVKGNYQFVEGPTGTGEMFLDAAEIGADAIINYDEMPDTPGQDFWERGTPVNLIDKIEGQD
jgi:hypothetical protein